MPNDNVWKACIQNKICNFFINGRTVDDKTIGGTACDNFTDFFSGIVFFRSVDKRQGIVVFGQGMVYAAHNVKHMRIPISSIFLQIGKIDNIGSSTFCKAYSPGVRGIMKLFNCCMNLFHSGWGYGGPVI